MQSIANRGARGTRQSRGIDLYLAGGFERTGKDLWLVENPANRSVYEVDTARNRCNCPDDKKFRHISGFLCKHTIAVNLKAAKLRKAARDLTGFFGGEAA